MSLKIKFSRTGSKNNPMFRIVVAEERSRRDGSPVAVIGEYNPKFEENKIKLDQAQLKHWLSVGAKPTDKVAAFIKSYVK